MLCAMALQVAELRGFGSRDGSFYGAGLCLAVVAGESVTAAMMVQPGWFDAPIAGDICAGSLPGSYVGCLDGGYISCCPDLFQDLGMVLH